MHPDEVLYIERPTTAGQAERVGWIPLAINRVLRRYFRHIGMAHIGVCNSTIFKEMRAGRARVL